MPGLRRLAGMIKKNVAACWTLSPRNQAMRRRGRGSPSWRTRRADVTRQTRTARSKSRQVDGGIATIGSSCTVTGDSMSTNWRALASELGRSIEARGWSLIQNGRAADESLWPPKPKEKDGDQPGRTLASLIDNLPQSNAGPRAHSLAERTLNPPAFTDDAEKAGLRFIHDNGHAGTFVPPPETMCGGVGLLDYDGDGWLDIYAVQGGPFPPSVSIPSDGDRLYHNRGDGTFEDVTDRAGIGGFARGYGHGVTVGDYDNDGRPDLFVMRWRSYALYRNKGDGRFEDVTVRSGLSGDRDWPTSAAFADLDGDGDLDLYVCHYLAYDPANPRVCDDPASSGKNECMPRDFPSLPDHVFRNDDGRFVDVTKSAGFVDLDGRGLGVVAAHLDDDDKIDLYVANDMSANYLFRNLRGL